MNKGIVMESAYEALSREPVGDTHQASVQTASGGLSVLDAIVQANLNLETLSTLDLEAFIQSDQARRRRQLRHCSDCFRTACG